MLQFQLSAVNYLKISKQRLSALFSDKQPMFKATQNSTESSVLNRTDRNCCFLVTLKQRWSALKILQSLNQCYSELICSGNSTREASCPRTVFSAYLVYFDVIKIARLLPWSIHLQSSIGVLVLPASSKGEPKAWKSNILRTRKQKSYNPKCRNTKYQKSQYNFFPKPSTEFFVIPLTHIEPYLDRRLGPFPASYHLMFNWWINFEWSETTGLQKLNDKVINCFTKITHFV